MRSGAEHTGQRAAPAGGPAAPPQQLKESDAGAGAHGGTGVVPEQTGPAASVLAANVPGGGKPSGGAQSSCDAAAAGQASPLRSGQPDSSAGPAAHLAGAQRPSQGPGQRSRACSPPAAASQDGPARQRAAQKDTAQELPRGATEGLGVRSAAASREASVHGQGRGRPAHACSSPVPSTQEAQTPQAQRQPRTRACKRKPVHQLHAGSSGEAVATSDASEPAAEAGAACLASPLKQPSKRRRVTGSAAASPVLDGKASHPVRRQARAQRPEVAALKPPAKVLATTRSGRRTTRISYAEAGAEEEQVALPQMQARKCSTGTLAAAGKASAARAAGTKRAPGQGTAGSPRQGEGAEAPASPPGSLQQAEQGDKAVVPEADEGSSQHPPPRPGARGASLSGAGRRGWGTARRQGAAAGADRPGPEAVTMVSVQPPWPAPPAAQATPGHVDSYGFTMWPRLTSAKLVHTGRTFRSEPLRVGDFARGAEEAMAELQQALDETLEGVDLSAVALDVRALRVAPLQEQLRSAAQQVEVQAAVAGPEAGAPCFADPPSPQVAAQDPSATLPGDSETQTGGPEPSMAPAAIGSQASGLAAGTAADSAAPPHVAGDAAQAPSGSSAQALAQVSTPASMQVSPAQPGLGAGDAAQATSGRSSQDPTQQPASAQELPALPAGDALQAAPHSSLQEPATEQQRPAPKRDRRVPAARRKRPDLQANGFIAQERKAAMVEEVQAASEAVRQQWERGMAGAAEVLRSVLAATSMRHSKGRQRVHRHKFGGRVAGGEQVGPQASMDLEAVDSAEEAAAQAGEHATGSTAAAEGGEGSQLRAAPAHVDVAAPEDMVAPRETVVVFRLHRFGYQVQPVMEVAMLGSHLLSNLRDCLCCEADANMYVAGRDKPSAFFYIEGCFFNDMRGKRDAAGEVVQPALDYSEPIRRFCALRGIACPPGLASAGRRSPPLDAHPLSAPPLSAPSTAPPDTDPPPDNPAAAGVAPGRRPHAAAAAAVPGQAVSNAPAAAGAAGAAGLQADGTAPAAGRALRSGSGTPADEGLTRHGIPSAGSETQWQLPETAGHRTAAMEHTRISDLFLRVGPGAGYVYCHQACCQHVLEVRDVRQLHWEDPQKKSDWPHTIFKAPEKRRWCDLCKGEVAKWITYDDTHSAKNPTFWCQKCYHLMHYDAEGDLKYHGFKAVPYTLEYAPRATVQLPKKGQ